MRRDFHTHPTVIQTPERFNLFIEQALNKGISEICVTDHMPLSISNAKDRIPAGRVGDYYRAVRELSKQYEGIIKINCGIEIDYHPSVKDEVERALQSGDFDYVLASTHMHLFTDDFTKYTFNEFAARALENSILAVETGLFHCVSHFDMYRFPFVNPDRFPLIDDGYSPQKHEDVIKELIGKIKKSGMYMEINPHLAEVKGVFSYMYPQEIITEWALAAGVKFSYGSDAHVPHSVGDLLERLEAHPVYGKALADWEKE